MLYVKIIRSAVLPILLLSLAGCMPTFNQETYPGPKAKLDVSNVPFTMICLDHQWMQLQQDQHGIATIPAGKRFTFASRFESDIYNYTKYTCEPKISFIVKPNKTYVLSFDINNKKCILGSFMQDPKARLGLVFESSLAVAGECQ